MKLNAILCTVGVCSCAWAADETKEVQLEEKDDTTFVSVEAGVSLDSRYMTYGVIDGKDPILTPSAQIKFFDWVYFGVESIFDVTQANGKRGGYGSRAGKWTTLDAIVGLAHEFDLGETLGTLGIDFNYIYEYIHRTYDDEGVRSMDDTQYLNLELSLGDLWLEPTLGIERDLMADNGTYVNFSIGHEFALIDGENEDDDPVLTFRPSIGQGLGNTQRARGYFVKHKGSEEALDHGGLMDTTVKGEFTWNVCEHVAFTGYLAYSDYLLDANMRDGARAHNAEWGGGCDHSWNFYGGLGVTVSF